MYFGQTGFSLTGALLCWTPFVIKATKKGNSKGGSIMEKKVLSAMKKAGKPLKTGEIAKMINADSKEVSKAMNGLKKEGKITSPKRCFWEPA